MKHHVTLPFGSTLWLYGFIASAFVLTGVLLFSRNLSTKQREQLRIGMAIFFIINLLSFHIYALYDGSWSISTTLPLHICTLAQVFGIIALLSKNQLAFEFACYFGIAGGVNSLLTPEFAHGYDKFYHIQYYFEHGGIILMPLFLRIAYGMKPRRLSWVSILMKTNFLAFFMYFFNRMVGGNYMYVNVKPVAENPFLIGDWPYYILALQLIVLIHFYIIYISFHRFRQWI